MNLSGCFLSTRVWSQRGRYATAVDWMIVPGLTLRNSVAPPWHTPQETTALISSWTVLRRRAPIAETHEWPWEQLSSCGDLFKTAALEPLLWLDSFRARTLALGSELHAVMETVVDCSGADEELQPLRAVFDAARLAYPDTRADEDLR